MRVVIKFLWKPIKWTFLLIASYLFVGILFSFLPTIPEKLSCQKNQSIYISTNGVHLDIIISKNILSEKLVEELNLPAIVTFISFGWGDKGFYLETPTWDKLKFSTAFNAMFLKSETAVHVTLYSNSYNDWKKIEICESQLEIILAHIEQSFKRNKEGAILEIENSGYSNHDTFYEANGSYSCINTCNVWVNRALKKASIKTSVWSPFDFGVIFHVGK